MKALGKPRPGRARVDRPHGPFDVTRDGFVIGEGAVVLVLERAGRRPRKRGAEPIAELVGYGASNDAYHIAAPHPEGIGVIEMMRAALDRAGLEPDADLLRQRARHVDAAQRPGARRPPSSAVFGEHAARLPVSSTKSMTGHLLVPPARWRRPSARSRCATASCRRPSTCGSPTRPATSTTSPRARAASHDLGYALSNSMGLGGHNGCTLLRRLES